MISSTTNPPERCHVLIVEDSNVLRQRLATVISENSGYELIGYADSEDGAVALARTTRVDVVVLDLHLKQGTGFGVMRALTRNGLVPTIIILSNYDLPEYKKAAAMLGAHYFLDKALHYSRLKQILEDIRVRRLGLVN